MKCKYCNEPSETVLCEGCLNKIAVKALKALRLEHSIDGQLIATTTFTINDKSK